MSCVPSALVQVAVRGKTLGESLGLCVKMLDFLILGVWKLVEYDNLIVIHPYIHNMFIYTLYTYVK